MESVFISTVTFYYEMITTAEISPNIHSSGLTNVMTLRLLVHGSLNFLLCGLNSFHLHSDLFKNAVFLIVLFSYPFHSQFLNQLCTPVSDT